VTSEWVIRREATRQATVEAWELADERTRKVIERYVKDGWDSSWAWPDCPKWLWPRYEQMLRESV
jgi:hypothetical protein